MLFFNRKRNKRFCDGKSDSKVGKTNTELILYLLHAFEIFLFQSFLLAFAVKIKYYFLSCTQIFSLDKIKTTAKIQWFSNL